MIYGDGLQSRDFTYVANVVRANLLSCESPAAGTATMNIACGERHTVLELLANLGRIVDTDVVPVFSEAKTGDVRHSQADITRAQQTIKYSVQVSFAEGLERTVNWFRNSGQTKEHGVGR